LAVRDPEPPPILKKRGEYEPDSDLRDAENVRLPADRVSYEQDPSHRQAGVSVRRRGSRGTRNLGSAFSLRYRFSA